MLFRNIFTPLVNVCRELFLQHSKTAVTGCFALAVSEKLQVTLLWNWTYGEHAT